MAPTVRHPASVGIPSVLTWALGCIVAAATSACGESTPPTRLTVVQLEITSSGSYLLQGKSVPGPELKHELKAIQATPGSIELQIAADSMAPYVAVGGAVKAAQDAGVAKVSFVTSESTP